MDALLACNATWHARRREFTRATDAACKSARNHFHRTVRSAKLFVWSKWLADIEHLITSRPRDSARAVRRRFHRNSSRVGRSLCPDPSASQEQKQACLNEWRDHFQRSAVHDHAAFAQQHFARVRRRIERLCNRCTGFTQSDYPFTSSEVRHAFQQCARSKTPGIDNIPYETFCVDLS